MGFNLINIEKLSDSFSLANLFKRKKNHVSEVVISSLVDIRLNMELQEKAIELFATTKADRFLLLINNNGNSEWPFVSVICHYHKQSDKTIMSIGAANKYYQLTTDAHYKKMVRFCEQDGKIEFTTTTMEDSLLKAIYESEGVTSSRVYGIKRYAKSVRDKDDAYTIASLATHTGEPFTATEKLHFDLFISWVRNVYAPAVIINVI